ncbi:unnamed protein product [Linum trigynum]
MPLVVCVCLVLHELPELAREALLCSGLVLTMCGLGWLMQRIIIKLMNKLFESRSSYQTENPRDGEDQGSLSA